MNLDRANGDVSGSRCRFLLLVSVRLASAEYLFGRVGGVHVLPLRGDPSTMLGKSRALEHDEF
jgi:hypothetical protein